MSLRGKAIKGSALRSGRHRACPRTGAPVQVFCKSSFFRAARRSNRCARFHVPLDRLHADGADGGDHMVVILAEGAADERGPHAGERLDLVIAEVHIGDDLIGGEGVVMVVRVGVVHQLAAAPGYGLCLRGVLVGPVAHNEERRRHAVFLQHIEDLLGVVCTPG